MRTLILSLVIGSLLMGVNEAGAQVGEPFTAADIIRLLTEGMPEPRVVVLVAESCVREGASEAVQQILIEAGAGQALLRVVAAVPCPEEEMAALIRILSVPEALSEGEVAQVGVLVLDGQGGELKEREAIWSVSNESVLAISPAGELRGMGAGQAVLSVAVDTVRAIAQVRVLAGPESVEVDPPSLKLTIGDEQALRVIVRDRAGNELEHQVQKEPADPGIAIVEAGRVRGIGVGETTLIIFPVGFSPERIPVTVSEGPVDPWVHDGLSRSELGMDFGDQQFSLIPAGSFQMGSHNGRVNERPVHTVTISRPFYLQRTPVTQGQWREIMGENPSGFSECGDMCPVESVNWNDAQAFIQALNRRYPGRNYRLPTEAEWEYAARAGRTGDYGSTGVLDDMGWYSGNSGGRTHPVALKQPNAWGLYDMHGNVWEWVQDRYSATYYSISPGVDPTGPTTGSSRVLRGGSWLSSANGARSASRSSNAPASRGVIGGFRLARTP